MTTSIFIELYDLLDDKGIKDSAKWKKIKGKRKRKINLLVAEYFRDKLPELVNIIEASEGIVLNFDKFKPKWNNTYKVAKKAVFYSDISIILIDNAFSVGKETQYHLDKFSSRKQKEIEKNKVQFGSLQDLVKVLLQIKLLVLRGIVIPLPINLMFDTTYKSELKIIQKYKKLTQKIKSNELDSFTVPVSLDNWKVKRQIEEIQEFKSSMTGLKPIQLSLPYLSNLQLDYLIDIREDNYEHFQRYQNALRNFLLTTPNIKSESTFIEIAKKVNNEIENLTQQVNTVSKKKNRKGAEMLFGTGLSLMTIFVDAEIAPYISGLIGGRTILNNLEFFNSDRNVLVPNDYHMAYITHKESLKKF